MKHRRICFLIRRDLIHGKQNKKFLGGGPRWLPEPEPEPDADVTVAVFPIGSGSLRLRLRLLLSSRGASSTSAAAAAALLRCDRLPLPLPSLLSPRRRLLSPLTTAASGSATPPSRPVPGREGGPLDPCVHVRVRFGRCSLVLGRSCTPMRNSGVLGVERTLLPAGPRLTTVPGGRPSPE